MTNELKMSFGRVNSEVNFPLGKSCSPEFERFHGFSGTDAA